MGTAGATRTATEGGDLAEQRVTPLELFFDLVFVFALTQVTGFLADHLTWVGMLQGAALLTALWSSWAVYSWLTNAVPAEEVIPARMVILTAMAAMFVASLAVPGAFGEYGVIFGVAYLVVQLLQVLLYALATSRVPEQRQAILRLAPGLVGAAALLIVAGFLDGFAQGALWALAITVGYGVPYVRGVSGFRVHAGHFAERHGPVVGVFRPRHAIRREEALRGEGRGAGEAGAGLLQLPAPADGGRDNLRCPRHQADPGPRWGSARDDRGRCAVRRRRPLPARAQRLQGARIRQRERPQAGGDAPMLRAHPRGGVGPLPSHPRHSRGAGVRAGSLRDGALSRVPPRAPGALEAAEHSVFT